MNNREIAERLVLLMNDAYPWDGPTLEETFHYLHETEADLERGGSETLKILKDTCEYFEDDEEILESARELIEQIQKRGTH